MPLSGYVGLKGRKPGEKDRQTSTIAALEKLDLSGKELPLHPRGGTKRDISGGKTADPPGTRTGKAGKDVG